MAEMNDHNPFIPLVSRQDIYGAISLASPSFSSYCDSSLPSFPFFTPPAFASLTLLLQLYTYLSNLHCDNLCFYRGSSLAVNNVFISIRSLHRNRILSPACSTRQKRKTSPALILRQESHQTSFIQQSTDPTASCLALSLISRPVCLLFFDVVASTLELEL